MKTTTILEVNFGREIKFRVADGWPYEGSLFRVREARQLDSGRIELRGQIAAKYLIAQLGKGAVLHEKESLSVLIDVGFDMAASDAWLAIEKARDEESKIRDAERYKAAKDKERVRDTAPELLDALKEAQAVLAANGVNFGKFAQSKAIAAIAKAEGS